MKITIVGTGYVGLVTGTCFAETGNDVMCIDIDADKIEKLRNGIIPIYEPGLEELVIRNVREGRLHFSTDIGEGIAHADMVFSAVPTPCDKDSRADLQYVKQVAKSFGELVQKPTIFVNKSTVPVGTGDICEEIIRQELEKRSVSVAFDVVSNPEFLREGAAIGDTMSPHRVVVGIENPDVEPIFHELYAPYTRDDAPLIITNRKSAEVIKYASNSFLATKISFINEIATFCKKAGADVTEVAHAMGLDPRIGKQFLRAGIGYGGSCFPKDIQALIYTGREYGYNFKILDAVEAVNKSQKKKLVKKLQETLPSLQGKTIGLWGLAFKPKTDDMRDAPSITIVKKLQSEGAIIRAFDPVAQEKARHFIADVNISYHSNPYAAASDVDALIIVTEWDAFQNIDLNRLRSEMKGNIILDGRNIYSQKDMEQYGFEYYSIGRGDVNGD